MFNKKGFTLLEVTISVGLLSLVMVFMFRLLSAVRRDEDDISLKTDLILNKTLVSKEINEVVRSSGGILSFNCSSNVCDFNLNDGTRKRLELKNDGKMYSFSDTNGTIISTRKLPEGFSYSLRHTKNNNLSIITLVVNSYEEYNIDIVDY